jgi:PHP family Zn ribbon phosphoesterase
MEQHNIDSRFKKGLENVSRQPSADAWARLQSRMQEAETAPVTEISEAEEKEERKVITWWYYAAAAVVVLLISVGVLKNSIVNGPESLPVALNKTPSEIHNSEVKATPEVSAPEIIAETKTTDRAIAQNSVKEKVTTQPETTESAKKSTKNAPAFASENATVQVAKTNQQLKAKEQKVTPVPASESIVKPEVQEEKVLLAATTEKPSSVKDQPQPAPSLGGMVIEVVVKKDANSEALAANTTTAGEPENKPALIKNLFKQAKSLKNGTGVNFQELGLSADSKLAHGTRTLHDKVTKVLDI